MEAVVPGRDSRAGMARGKFRQGLYSERETFPSFLIGCTAGISSTQDAGFDGLGAYAGDPAKGLHFPED